MRKFNVSVNGSTYEVVVEEMGTHSHVAPIQNVVAPAPVTAPIVNKTVEQPKVSQGETVVAPMPGTILDIKVSEGSSVKEGEILLILEAMKMENEIVAPRAGKVVQIVTTKGASVNAGDVLIVMS